MLQLVDVRYVLKIGKEPPKLVKHAILGELISETLRWKPNTKIRIEPIFMPPEFPIKSQIQDEIDKQPTAFYKLAVPTGGLDVDL